MDLADPQSWQGYAYADNRPTTDSDPTGTYINTCQDNDNNFCVSRPHVTHKTPCTNDTTCSTRVPRCDIKCHLKKPALPGEPPLGWLKRHHYKGSNDFTLGDAIAFANNGDPEAALYVCEHVLNLGRSACGDTTGQAEGANPLVAVTVLTAAVACIAFFVVCATAIAEGTLAFASGGSVGGMRAGAGLVDDAEDLTGPALARKLGKEGEDLAGIRGPKVRIDSLTGTANYRVPDQLTDTFLLEVKNEAELSLTSQLQDFDLYAQQEGLAFILLVRTNTKISQPLQDLVNTGKIVLLRGLPG